MVVSPTDLPEVRQRPELQGTLISVIEEGCFLLVGVKEEVT